jgi:hypothetical protein
LCRILHTLQSGTIVSKLDAAAWAVTKLAAQWHDLVRQAVADRARDRVCASDAMVAQTLRLIECAQASAGLSPRAS